MNNINDIIDSLQNSLYGRPWFGKSIVEILEETDPQHANSRLAPTLPTPNELLYHMLNWAEFTLNSLIRIPAENTSVYDENDWRILDAQSQKWETGFGRFITINQLIIEVLKTQQDPFLTESVRARKYDIGFLVSGLIQHNIYHAGQIALINRNRS